jgi:hypothetical protein
LPAGLSPFVQLTATIAGDQLGSIALFGIIVGGVV